MLSYEKNFRYYLDHPNAKMDNNTAERALRKIVIGRKLDVSWKQAKRKSNGKSYDSYSKL